MSWDEPQRHWTGAIRTNYLKSLEFGKFQFRPGSWSEIEPGLYDTFSFLVSDLFLKIFPGKLIGIKHLINSRHKNIASKLIENIKITRIQNQVIVNSWKEGINVQYPNYMNASESLQLPQREQFVGTNLGNTREGKTEESFKEVTRTL